MTFAGNETQSGTFSTQEDYIRARDLANRIPEFSGTPRHASFEQFERAVNNALITIPSDGTRKLEYVRQILLRILEPAKLVVCNVNIKDVETILKLLARNYSRNRDIHFYTNKIQNLCMYEKENLEDFLRRLAVLVAYGQDAAVHEFGVENRATHTQALNFYALRRFKEYAPLTLQETMHTRNVSQ